ncbi:MAG: 16S rRNA (adenine(1518)-N(6)/adenine(1519)-N(6))-dimethyltransferase RsmA [Alphaproteobacteria bacterium]
MVEQTYNTLDGLPPLRDIIAQANLKADKSLGQNFLLDLNLTDKIARAAGPFADHTVLEVGPGPGGLTRMLLAHEASPLIAIEQDDRAVKALAYLQAAHGTAFDLRAGDALALNISTLGDRPIKIVANLPYNIATPLLINWLVEIEQRHANVTSMTLMFQKEVADRIAAQPGTKQWGRLSILSQWLCETRRLFDLPPEAFTPPPKITSTIVQLTPRAQPLAAARSETLQKVVAQAFNQRRKMLRQSLKPLGGEALLEKGGIDPTRRAETLSIEEFCALANILDETEPQNA